MDNIHAMYNGSESWSNASTVLYLVLPLSTDAPDLLGFANVNGFYGPGSWAVWFLAVMSSWIALITQSTSGVTSLCGYLLSLNAVAIHHLNQLCALVRLKNSSDPSWTHKSAAVAAAYVITWWGLCTILAQMVATPIFSSHGSVVAKRFLILAVGSVIPAISSALIVKLIDETICETMPALYWRGMGIREEYFWMPHEKAYQYSAFLGIWFLAVHCLFAFAIILLILGITLLACKARFPGHFENLRCRIPQNPTTLAATFYTIFFLTLVVASF